MGDSRVPRDRLASGRLLLTPEEAAEVLRIGRTTVYALIKEGKLGPVHIGRSCRISRAELERYVGDLDAPSARRLTTSRRRGPFELDATPPDAA